MAALKKLRVKGSGLAKEDPNAVKRKRSNSTDVTTRVQKNLSSPDGKHLSARTHTNRESLFLPILCDLPLYR